MKDLEKARMWLRRAHSNLNFAKTGMQSKDILYEDICFETHQAVEKALKELFV